MHLSRAAGFLASCPPVSTVKRNAAARPRRRDWPLCRAHAPVAVRVRKTNHVIGFQKSPPVNEQGRGAGEGLSSLSSGADDQGGSRVARAQGAAADRAHAGLGPARHGAGAGRGLEGQQRGGRPSRVPAGGVSLPGSIPESRAPPHPAAGGSRALNSAAAVSWGPNSTKRVGRRVPSAEDSGRTASSGADAVGAPPPKSPGSERKPEKERGPEPRAKRRERGKTGLAKDRSPRKSRRP